MFHMVGYLAAEVKEAGERVRTAIRNSGITFPPKRTVINLSPGNIRKRGSSFDLAIALSILVSLGEIPISVLESAVVVGELGLDGSIRQVAGVLPIVWEAREQGMKMCLISCRKQRGSSFSRRDPHLCIPDAPRIVGNTVRRYCAPKE